MNTITVQFIDPPSGWMYGFPKPMPKKVKDTTEWCLKNGYPQREVDLCGDHFYSRFWRRTVTEDELKAMVGHDINLEDYACGA